MDFSQVIPGINPVVAIAMVVFIVGVLVFTVAPLILRGHKANKARKHAAKAQAKRVHA